MFLNSSLTRVPGPLNHEIADNQTWLARSGGSVSYFDNIVFINTKMDAHIRTAGWNTSPLPNPVIATATSGWREFASMNLAGDTLDVSGRVADSSYQLSLGEVASSYCNRAQIFAAYNNGAGWNPLPSDTTDCINFGESGSGSSSSAASSGSSESSSSSSSVGSSSSISEASSSSAESASSEPSSSSSAAHVPTTTTWVPSYTELQSAVAAAPALNSNANFNATISPLGFSNIKLYSSGLGNLRLHLNSGGTAYAINYNGTALKSDSNATPVVLVEGTSGQVDPTSLNASGGVTRFLSVPVTASSDTLTLTVTYSNASNNYDASTQPNGCLNGQIALVDQMGKTWKVASACGTGQSTISATISDANVTELYVLMTRNTDTGGGIRIWQIEVTR